MTGFYTPSDTLLILGAVPQEITVLVDALEDVSKNRLWGIPYWQGLLHGKPVAVAITGIGKVYTAMTATLFLAELKPRLVVMTGTGARINQTLRTGDVIVAETLFEHDYGSLTRDDMVYRPFNSPIDGAEVENRFSPSASLLASAEQAISSYECPEIANDGAPYTVKVRRGTVSSSDLFGMTEQRIERLRERFNTDIVEMESAPLARLCQTFSVPYLVVRAGSNGAQEAPNDDYLRLGPIAADQAARFSLHLIRHL
jgi:adenosylhomocysteine nucleosidase/futalosine hydrolase